MDTLKTIDWNQLSPQMRQQAIARPEFGTTEREQAVADIIDQVRSGGDKALIGFTQQFDGIDLERLELTPADLNSAAGKVETALLSAIVNAIERIHQFHKAGMPQAFGLDTAPGLRCEAVYRPINPVGLYVPGGSAPLISTALMLAIPAQLAGCQEVALCTPPGPDGSVNPALLAAAQLCGIKRVFCVGGAQAIAAMAFGTESIPSCAKLFGPGNAWVTEAKRQVSGMSGGAAQDMPAGPSEVLVIADSTADARSVAWDLLSQAEHGPDSQSLLISDSQRLLDDVCDVLPELASSLPRAEILDISLRNARLVLSASMQQAVEISNRYAPEHLILNCQDPQHWLDKVSTAGSVFVGPWTPESLGDYSSGTNHVLPTYGHANAYSGLSVTDFMRRMTIQTADPQGLAIAGADTVLMAAAEGLDAHRMAVQYRLSTIDSARAVKS